MSENKIVFLSFFLFFIFFFYMIDFILQSPPFENEQFWILVGGRGARSVSIVGLH